MDVKMSSDEGKLPSNQGSSDVDEESIVRADVGARRAGGKYASPLGFVALVKPSGCRASLLYRVCVKSDA